MLLCSFIQETWVISHRILIMNDLHLVDDRALCYYSYKNYPRSILFEIILTFSDFIWYLIFILNNMQPRGRTLAACLFCIQRLFRSQETEFLNILPQRVLMLWWQINLGTWLPKLFLKHWFFSVGNPKTPWKTVETWKSM